MNGPNRTFHNRSKKYRFIVKVLRRAKRPLTAREIATREPRLKGTATVGATIRFENGGEVEITKEGTRRRYQARFRCS